MPPSAGLSFDNSWGRSVENMAEDKEKKDDKDENEKKEADKPKEAKKARIASFGANKKCKEHTSER